MQHHLPAPVLVFVHVQAEVSLYYAFLPFLRRQSMQVEGAKDQLFSDFTDSYRKAVNYTCIHARNHTYTKTPYILEHIPPPPPRLMGQERLVTVLSPGCRKSQ